MSTTNAAAKTVSTAIVRPANWSLSCRRRFFLNVTLLRYEAYLSAWAGAAAA